MALEQDIIEKILQSFPAAEAAKAIDALSASGKSGRLARCMVFASDGKLKVLRDQIELADRDYRDAIVGGEYVDWRETEDFTVSFLIDSPEKFWISGAARMMAARDYTLSSVSAVPLTPKPPYFSEAGEGDATFEGDLGQIHISLNDGLWTMATNRTDQEIFALNKSFDNESAFIDVLSGYILSKRKPRL